MAKNKRKLSCSCSFRLKAFVDLFVSYESQLKSLFCKEIFSFLSYLTFTLLHKLSNSFLSCLASWLPKIQSTKTVYPTIANSIVQKFNNEIHSTNEEDTGHCFFVDPPGNNKTSTLRVSLPAIFPIPFSTLHTLKLNNQPVPPSLIRLCHL